MNLTDAYPFDYNRKFKNKPKKKISREVSEFFNWLKIIQSTMEEILSAWLDVMLGLLYSKRTNDFHQYYYYQITYRYFGKDSI